MLSKHISSSSSYFYQQQPSTIDCYSFIMKHQYHGIVSARLSASSVNCCLQYSKPRALIYVSSPMICHIPATILSIISIVDCCVPISIESQYHPYHYYAISSCSIVYEWHVFSSQKSIFMCLLREHMIIKPVVSSTAATDQQDSNR